MSTRADLYKVVAFVLVTGFFLTIIGMTMGNVRIEDSHEYKAVFSDISGMKKGSPVRAAGVDVGRVKGLELQTDNTIVVTFSAAVAVPVTDKTNATIRYANLTGDRYLDLTEPSAGNGSTLSPGSTIPATQTAPALDLDVLTNGFRPLMRGLEPDQINELSGSLIAVFQGQAGAVSSVLTHVASLTSDLAQRDELIGSLIANLDKVLKVADSRRAEFGSLIRELQLLTTGLAADRKTIGSSLQGINTAAGTTARFLALLRPELDGTVRQIGRLSTNLAKNTDQIDRSLRLLPGNLQLAGRVGAYGSFFNIYLCGVRVLASDAAGVAVYTPWTLADVPRCKLKEPRK